jgi:hypothetical protein
MLDPKGIDFVIPLGRSSQFKNCELRYCLRSLEKHGKGIRRVVIVGDERPDFLSDEAIFLQAPEFPVNKESRIAIKIQWAFENSDLTDEILFGNDDYFFLRDFDARTVPFFQRGPLLDMKPVTVGNQELVQDTHDALVAANLPTSSYELHYPNRYRRKIYCNKLKDWWTRSIKSRHGLAPKSIYGNFVCRKEPGPFLADLKIARYFGEDDVAKRIAATPDRICLSYGDQALFEGFEKWLYSRFPEKSSFEMTWGSGTQ